MSELLDIPSPSPTSSSSSLLPSIDTRSPFDLAVLALVSSHLLFSAFSAAFVIHFHLRSVVGLPSSTSLRRRLRLLLRLNSLWPVRLLLLLFASLFSLSELLRLTLRHPYLCDAYALASQSFAEPAFFVTLLFLLRLSSSEHKQSPSLSLVSAFATAVFAASPFLLVHSLFIFVWPWALQKLSLPIDFLAGAETSSADSGRCTHPLYGTVLLALFASVYVPLFISASWKAVNVVINKRLRVRLYALAAVVVAALSTQVASMAAASLWGPGRSSSQWLTILSFASVLVCVAVGEGILVVQPVVDALAIVEPEDGKQEAGEHRLEEGGAKREEEN